MPLNPSLPPAVDWQQRLLERISDLERLVETLAAAPGAIRGNGNPNGAVTSAPGTLYVNLAGGSSSTLYVKETGTGNTGWVAK